MNKFFKVLKKIGIIFLAIIGYREGRSIEPYPPRDKDRDSDRS